MATYEAVIELRFGKSLVGKDCRYNGDIVWRQSKNGPKSDKLKISGKSVQLTCVRSRKVKPEAVLNDIARRSLRTAALYIASVEGRMPSLDVVTMASGGMSTTYQHDCMGPAARLFEWGYDCQRRFQNDLLAPPEVARIMFYQTQTAKAARVSVSFLLAAMQAVGDTERLRFLWSAFNPLYQVYYYLSKGERKTADRDCLCELSAQIRGCDLRLTRAEKRLSQMDCVWLADGLNWGFYESEQSESDRGRFMNKQIFIETAPWRQRLSFIVTRYLYFCRCKTMHGNVSYPIFPLHESDAILGDLCDVLTLAIFDMIEACQVMEERQNAPQEHDEAVS